MIAFNLAQPAVVSGLRLDHALHTVGHTGWSGASSGPTRPGERHASGWEAIGAGGGGV